METERQDQASFRELRLEGIGLFMVGGVLLALMVGAFYAGRWFERRDAASTPLQPGDTAAESEPAESSVPAKPTFFDDLRGSEKQAEPRREVTPAPQARIREQAPTPAEPPPPSQQPSAESPAPAQPARDEPFFVQVFAGRDRVAAENLIQKLQGEGYQGRLFAEREGQGELLRVRVVGYATDEDARAAERRLQALGYSTWVQRAD